MKAALDEKLVGEPLKLRYINGHTGPLGKGAKHRGVSENAEEMTDEQRSKTWWHKEKFGGGVYLDICRRAVLVRPNCRVQKRHNLHIRVKGQHLVYRLARVYMICPLPRHILILIINLYFGRRTYGTKRFFERCD